MKAKILDILEKNRGQSVSGARIAQELGVSRSAVWKWMNQLRSDGYDIQSTTNRGYTLNSLDNTLSQSAIAKFLPSSYFGQIHVYDAIASTNITAKQLAQSGAPHGTLIAANTQIQGRGRMGRSFYSPPQSGVYFSLILRANCGAQDSGLITSGAAVIVADTIKQLYGIDARIKWVNDVYINEKKVCGILTEGSVNMENSQMEYVILGIGINVSPPSNGFEGQLQTIATTLSQHTKTPVLINQLIGHIANQVLTGLDDMLQHKLIAQYKNLSFVIGKQADLVSGAQQTHVTILDIDDNAHLVVRGQDGQVFSVSSGEISLRNIK